MLAATIDLLEADCRGGRDRPEPASAGSASTSTRTRIRSRSACLALWAGSQPGRVRRRRRGPDDLQLHRRVEPLPARLSPGAIRARRIVALTENYRSSPEILGLANRLIAAARPDQGADRHPAVRVRRRRWRAMPMPTPSWPAWSTGHRGADRRRDRPGRDRDPRPDECPAGPDRGRPDHGRHPVHGPRRPVLRASRRPRRRSGRSSGPGSAPPAGTCRRPSRRSSHRRSATTRPPARPGRRSASGPPTWRSCWRSPGTARPAAGRRAMRAAFLADLAARDGAERANTSGGVTLSTIHRAKGLEWDAVFLPGLEEGNLPAGQAAGDPEAIAEERRLLYVGITRARRYLALSWAGRRAGSGGREGSRHRSRFLDDLGGPVQARPRAPARRAPAGPAPSQSRRRPLRPADQPRPADAARFEALRTWRSERARADGVPAYVVAHDATLRAIADERSRLAGRPRPGPGDGPRPARALRRRDPGRSSRRSDPTGRAGCRFPELRSSYR